VASQTAARRTAAVPSAAWAGLGVLAPEADQCHLVPPLVGIEQEADDGAQALRPALRGPERRRAPVQRSHEKARVKAQKIAMVIASSAITRV